VCLLIALFAELPDAPLLVAAIRDEGYSRPAVAMTVLRAAGPRILGGRDQLAGGTWLAVNEHGVVAGLTNQPSPSGRDAAKRSRGELPLAFAAHRSAREAVAAVTPTLDAGVYNPCWMLVGDRNTLFFIGLNGSGRAEVEQLPPGLYILENSPLRPPSPKAEYVAALVAQERAARPGDAAAVADALKAVLRDHRPVPPPPSAPPPSAAAPARPAALSAPCVHTPEYGTRSGLIVTVPPAGPARLQVADGPPCEVPFADATGLWASPAPDGATPDLTCPT